MDKMFDECNKIKVDMIKICDGVENRCITLDDIPLVEKIDDIENYISKIDAVGPTALRINAKTALNQLSCLKDMDNQEDKNDFLKTLLGRSQSEASNVGTGTVFDEEWACRDTGALAEAEKRGIVDNVERNERRLVNSSSYVNVEEGNCLSGIYRALENSNIDKENYGQLVQRIGQRRQNSERNSLAQTDQIVKINDTKNLIEPRAEQIEKNFPSEMSFPSYRTTNTFIPQVQKISPIDTITSQPVSPTVVVGDSRSDDRSSLESVRQERSRINAEIEEIKRQRELLQKERDSYNSRKIQALEKRLEELSDKDSTSVADRSTKEVMPETFSASDIERRPTSFTYAPQSTPTPVTNGGDIAPSDIGSGDSIVTGVSRSGRGSVLNKGPIVLTAKSIEEVSTQDLQKFLTDEKTGVLTVTLADNQTYLVPVRDGVIILSEAQLENTAPVQNTAEIGPESQLEYSQNLHPELLCSLYPILGKPIPEGINCEAHVK